MTGDRPPVESGNHADTPGELAVIVRKPRTERAIAALGAEGVYDTDRSAEAYDADRVALPVTSRPRETAVDEITEVDLPSRTEGLPELLRERGWSEAEIERAPSSWAVIGSVVLVRLGDVPAPADVGEALLELHGEADTVLERRGIRNTERRPDVAVLAGTGVTETVHVEHGTRYALDLSTVMFSPGNKAERARMGRLVEPGDRVFDMFAGIGYFTLPMARAGADVTATEIRPIAFRYLLENAVMNEVSDRVEAIRADCRAVDPTADRVVMGHYDAHEYLPSALGALTRGGMLHLHGAGPQAVQPDRAIKRLERAVAAADRDLEVDAVRDVKGYSAGVRHIVVDARVW